MATPIPGFTQGTLVNTAAFQSAFVTLSALTGVPLVGNQEAIAQRLEELTGIVGTIAEALVHTAPAVNIGTANTETLATTLVTLQSHINQVETKVDWSEHQRAQGNSPGGQRESYQKPACESKAMMSIKTRGSDKTGFRLWNQKIINAITTEY